MTTDRNADRRRKPTRAPGRCCRAERTWGSWKLGISLATAAAATWCYIIGEYVGYYLGFGKGFAALAAGSMIGMLIVAARGGADLHPLRGRFHRLDQAAIRLQGLDHSGRACSRSRSSAGTRCC